MKNKIRLAIVGTGYFSQFHYDAWERLNVEVVAICSLNKNEALARSNDQQLAGAIIFLLTATIVFVNFVTDIILAIMDPRIRRGVMGGS